MEDQPIYFFSEEIDFSLPSEENTVNWLLSVADNENQDIDSINYIFCSDEYLLQVNREYLDHDYYTDIITFDNRDSLEEAIESDIFVSIDRVEENAKEQNTTFQNELHRVLVHGLLHLIGYNDKTDEEQSQMREKESTYLSLLNN